MASLAFGSNLNVVPQSYAVGWKSRFGARKSFSDSTNLLKLNWKLNNSSSKTQCSEFGVPRATAEVMDDEEEKKQGRLLRVGVICGGPSTERGISLNSARSVLDHIQGEDLHVSCYYIDYEINAYAISSAQVYSNTPADFDFKLESLAHGFSSLSEFAEHLAASVDIVFPVIYGRFGEDGGIQELLEIYNMPFIGTGASECCQALS